MGSIEALRESVDSWKQLYYAVEDDGIHLTRLLGLATSFRVGAVNVERSRDPEKPGWWVRTYDGNPDQYVDELDDAISIADKCAQK